MLPQWNAASSYCTGWVKFNENSLTKCLVLFIYLLLCSHTFVVCVYVRVCGGGMQCTVIIHTPLLRFNHNVDSRRSCIHISLYIHSWRWNSRISAYSTRCLWYVLTTISRLHQADIYVKCRKLICVTIHNWDVYTMCTPWRDDCTVAESWPGDSPDKCDSLAEFPYSFLCKYHL